MPVLVPLERSVNQDKSDRLGDSKPISIPIPITTSPTFLKRIRIPSRSYKSLDDFGHYISLLKCPFRPLLSSYTVMQHHRNLARSPAADTSLLMNVMPLFNIQYCPKTLLYQVCVIYISHPSGQMCCMCYRALKYQLLIHCRWCLSLVPGCSVLLSALWLIPLLKIHLSLSCANVHRS